MAASGFSYLKDVEETNLSGDSSLGLAVLSPSKSGGKYASNIPSFTTPPKQQTEEQSTNQNSQELPVGGYFLSPFSPLLANKQAQRDHQDSLSLMHAPKVTVVAVIQEEEEKQQQSTTPSQEVLKCIFPPPESDSKHTAQQLVLVKPSAFGKYIPTKMTLETAQLVAHVAQIASEDWARLFQFSHVSWSDDHTFPLARTLVQDVLVRQLSAAVVSLGHGPSVLAAGSSGLALQVANMWNTATAAESSTAVATWSCLEVLGDSSVYDALADGNTEALSIRHVDTQGAIVDPPLTQVATLTPVLQAVLQGKRRRRKRKLPTSARIATLNVWSNAVAHQVGKPPSSRITLVELVPPAPAAGRNDDVAGKTHGPSMVHLGKVLREIMLQEHRTLAPKAESPTSEDNGNSNGLSLAVSFRESLLTQLLQRQLQHDKIVLLAGVSPLTKDYDSSAATLNYCRRLSMATSSAPTPFPTKNIEKSKGQQSQADEATQAWIQKLSVQQTPDKFLQQVLSDPRQRLAKLSRGARPPPTPKAHLPREGSVHDDSERASPIAATTYDMLEDAVEAAHAAVTPIATENDGNDKDRVDIFEDDGEDEDLGEWMPSQEHLSPIRSNEDEGGDGDGDGDDWEIQLQANGADPVVSEETQSGWQGEPPEVSATERTTYSEGVDVVEDDESVVAGGLDYDLPDGEGTWGYDEPPDYQDYDHANVDIGENERLGVEHGEDMINKIELDFEDDDPEMSGHKHQEVDSEDKGASPLKKMYGAQPIHHEGHDSIALDNISGNGGHLDYRYAEGGGGKDDSNGYTADVTEKPETIEMTQYSRQITQETHEDFRTQTVSRSVASASNQEAQSNPRTGGISSHLPPGNEVIRALEDLEAHMDQMRFIDVSIWEAMALSLQRLKEACYRHTEYAASMAARCEEAQRDSDGLQSQLRETTHDLERKRTALNTLESRLEIVAMEKDELDQLLNESSTLQDELQRKNEGLEQELSTLRQKIDLTSKDLRSAEDRSERTHTLLQTTRSMLDMEKEARKGMESTVKDLQETLASTRAEKNRLQQEHSTCRSRIHDLESNLLQREKQLSSANSSQTQQRQADVERIRELERKMRDSSREKLLANQKSESLERQLQDDRSQMNLLVSERNRLAELVETLRADALRTADNNDDVHTELYQLKVAKECLESDRAYLEQQRKDDQDKILSLELELRNTKQLMDNSTSSMRRLEETKRDDASTIAGLQDEVNRLREAVRSREKELSSVQVDGNRKFQELLTSNTGKVQEQARLIASLRDEVSRLTAECESVKTMEATKIHSLNKDMEMLRRRAKEAEDNFSSSSTELTSLARQSEALETRCMLMEKDLKEKSALVEKHRLDFQRLEEELQNARLKEKEVSSQLWTKEKDTRRQTRELESQLAAANARDQDSMRRLKEKTKELDDLHREVDRLRNQSTSQGHRETEEIQDLRGRLALAEKERDMCLESLYQGKQRVQQMTSSGFLLPSGDESFVRAPPEDSTRMRDQSYHEEDWDWNLQVRAEEIAACLALSARESLAAASYQERHMAQEAEVDSLRARIHALERNLASSQHSPSPRNDTYDAFSRRHHRF